jgi:hypothetical protein
MEALAEGECEVWISRPVAPLVLFAQRVHPLADTGIDLLGLPGVAPPLPLLRALDTFDRIHSWYGTQRPDFRDAVARWPFTFHDAHPTAPPTAVPRIAIRGPHHGAVIIHPFSGSARKNWPLANYRALAARIGGPVEWTAGPEELLPEARRFDNLADLAHWISGARLYIGNDSGITHLAAAVGTPTAALFGPTDPAIWCPAGDHVRAIRFAPVEEVEEQLRLFMAALSK